MTNVTVGTQGLLIIDGRNVPVYSGTIHYWRLERDRWPTILDQAKALGFSIVETYIPWSTHEIAPGTFDFGQQDPRKDVDAFMRLCEERDLWLLVRPGPLINAELTDFGFPEWVLLDEEVQARTALDTVHLDAAWGLHPPHQFPVPSYASERFFEYVGGWFDAICPIIKAHLAPDGCVVAVQSDNETCYLFFDLPYATDYSRASLRLYRLFLEQHYGSIEALNTTYGTGYEAFEAVEPPRDGPIEHRQDAPWKLDWVAYKEYQIRWSVARFARMLRERGVRSVPIFHDVAFQYKTPIDIPRMEADPDIDWVGLNLYRPPWEHRQLADRVRFLTGSTKLPFVPELGSGLWSHHPATATPAEHEFVTLSTLMYGLKAFNFYMLVERERWQGSPITRHGTLRDEYAAFTRRLMAFLREHEFWRFRRSPRVLVLLSFDLGRFEAANSTLNWGHVDLLRLPAAFFQDERSSDLGLQPSALAESWLSKLTDLLRQRCIDYDLSDTHIDPARLQAYDVVFVQSAEFFDAADAARLSAYRGTLLVGPTRPTLDPYLRPHNVAPTNVRIADVDALPPLIDELLGKPEFRIDPPAEVVAHTDGQHTLLFLSNPTPSEVRTTLRCRSTHAFENVWANTASATATHDLDVSLGPYTVSIWEAQ
jgi:beta-galactosidase